MEAFGGGKWDYRAPEVWHLAGNADSLDSLMHSGTLSISGPALCLAWGVFLNEKQMRGLEAEAFTQLIEFQRSFQWWGRLVTQQQDPSMHVFSQAKHFSSVSQWLSLQECSVAQLAMVTHLALGHQFPLGC